MTLDFGSFGKKANEPTTPDEQPRTLNFGSFGQSKPSNEVPEQPKTLSVFNYGGFGQSKPQDQQRSLRNYSI